MAQVRADIAGACALDLGDRAGYPAFNEGREGIALPEPALTRLLGNPLALSLRISCRTPRCFRYGIYVPQAVEDTQLDGSGLLAPMGQNLKANGTAYIERAIRRQPLNVLGTVPATGYFTDRGYNPTLLQVLVLQAEFGTKRIGGATLGRVLVGQTVETALRYDGEPTVNILLPVAWSHQIGVITGGSLADKRGGF